MNNGFPNVTLPGSDEDCTSERNDVVKIKRISRAEPNDVVRALFSKPVAKSKNRFEDDDPGPSAA